MAQEIFSLNFAETLASAALRIGTPLAFATLGETVSQRAGVISLGLEANLLVSALTAVAVQVATGNTVLAVLAAGVASALVSLMHVLLTCVLGANQIVTGIAISFLGGGLTALLGRDFVGKKFAGIATWPLPGLSEIPILGPVLGRHDALVYLAPVLCIGVWLLLNRTRFGLELRAAGENPEVAATLGIPVRRRVIPAVILGGFLAGLGGAHLSLAYAHAWQERMSAGQGWLAVGLVILARWRPLGALVAAYFFGGLAALHPNLQAAGLQVSNYLIAMLPYALTIVALVWQRASARNSLLRDMPESLEKQFTVNRI